MFAGCEDEDQDNLTVEERSHFFFFFFFSILLIYLENSEPRSVKFKWKLSNLDMLTVNTQFNNIQTLMRT